MNGQRKIATLSGGMEYARGLRALIWEARAAGYDLVVSFDDLDLVFADHDGYIATLCTIKEG